MLLFMRRELAIVKSEMECARLSGRTDTNEYRELKYRRRLVSRIIRKLEAAEKKGFDTKSNYIKG